MGKVEFRENGDVFMCDDEGKPLFKMGKTPNPEGFKDFLREMGLEVEE